MKRVTAVAVFIAAAQLALPASAQLPPVPGVPAPEVPQPVLDAVEDADATARPYVQDAARAAEPAVNAGGFAVRPACVYGSTIALVFALTGAPLDASMITVPYIAVCRGAMRSGPADPVLGEADETAGPPLRSAAEPALREVNTHVRPLRGDLAPVCTGLSLVGPSGFPPPVSRFNPVYEVCWR